MIKDICGNHLLKRKNLIFLFLLFLIKGKYFTFFSYRMDPIFLMSSDEESSSPTSLSNPSVIPEKPKKKVSFADISEIALISEGKEKRFDFSEEEVNFTEKGTGTNYLFMKMINKWFQIGSINPTKFFELYENELWASQEYFEDLSSIFDSTLQKISEKKGVNLGGGLALPWDEELGRVTLNAEKRVQSCYTQYKIFHELSSEKAGGDTIYLKVEKNPLAQIVTPQTEPDDLERRFNALLQFAGENKIESVEPAQPEKTLARSAPSMICGVPRRYNR